MERSSDVAFGEGSIWVTTLGDDSLWRVDAPEVGPTTVSNVILVGRQPSAVAVGPDAVWVANRGDGTVSRIDPRTNKVVATIHVGGARAGSQLALTASGSRSNSPKSKSDSSAQIVAADGKTGGDLVDVIIRDRRASERARKRAIRAAALRKRDSRQARVSLSPSRPQMTKAPVRRGSSTS